MPPMPMPILIMAVHMTVLVHMTKPLPIIQKHWNWTRVARVGTGMFEEAMVAMPAKLNWRQGEVPTCSRGTMKATGMEGGERWGPMKHMSKVVCVWYAGIPSDILYKKPRFPFPLFRVPGPVPVRVYGVHVVAAKMSKILMEFNPGSWK